MSMFDYGFFRAIIEFIIGVVISASLKAFSDSGGIPYDFILLFHLLNVLVTVALVFVVPFFVTGYILEWLWGLVLRPSGGILGTIEFVIYPIPLFVQIVRFARALPPSSRVRAALPPLPRRRAALLVGMKSRELLMNIVILSGISVLITTAVYFFNIWLLLLDPVRRFLRRHDVLLIEGLSPTGMFFVEGMLFVVVGLLLLLGRGGIDLWSTKRTISRAAATRSIYDEEAVGPGEIFRKDMWKPKGRIGIALILMLAGAFMILTYLLTL